MLIDVGDDTISEYECNALVEEIIMDHDFGFPYDILNKDVVNRPHREAEYLERAADIIGCKFYWASTEEGPKYWDNVYDALIRIAEKGR